MFSPYGRGFLALDANPTSHFLVRVFFGIRLPSESLEPLIGLLAYLVPKLWLKKQKLVKIISAQMLTQGVFFPWP